jgi:hypothetical protein
MLPWRRGRPRLFTNGYQPLFRSKRLFAERWRKASSKKSIMGERLKRRSQIGSDEYELRLPSWPQEEKPRPDGMRAELVDGDERLVCFSALYNISTILIMMK